MAKGINLSENGVRTSCGVFYTGSTAQNTPDKKFLSAVPARGSCPWFPPVVPARGSRPWFPPVYHTGDKDPNTRWAHGGHIRSPDNV